MANSAPADSRWTPEQSRAIHTTGHSILVSAAAGSGKTAVLAERCAHLVCNADPPCGVDELLVVTFTNAAAKEMRDRIEKVLRDRLEKQDDPRLTRQLALIERAQISTLHGFCSRVIKQNFYLLGSIRISPRSMRKRRYCSAAKSRATFSRITTQMRKPAISRSLSISTGTATMNR